MKIMKRIYQFLLLAAGCAALTTACSDDDDSYLVRETDSIRFASCLASSKQITLRCNGSWRTVIPEDAGWLSTSPSEGVGSGAFEWIAVSATHNRSAERTATIYLESGGRQYPITVTQADGAVVYGAPYVEGNLIEQEASKSRLCFTYANAYGDETIDVSCTLSGDSQGLSVAGASVRLVNGGATVALDIAGTPTVPGYAAFAVSVDGVQIGTARAKVYAMSEMPIEGLPVTWEFCPVKGSTEDVNALKARQPDWVTASHSLVSEDGRAYITVVEADAKTASAVNSWGYNDGHAYLKGLYTGDYWLQKIPVKYLRLRHEDQLYGQHRRFGLFGGVLPDRVLGRRADLAAGRRCEERNLQQYRGDLPCPRLRQSAFRRREYGLFLVRLPRRGHDQFGYALDTLPGLGQRAHYGEQYDHYGRRRFDAPEGHFLGVGRR